MNVCEIQCYDAKALNEFGNITALDQLPSLLRTVVSAYTETISGHDPP